MNNHLNKDLTVIILAGGKSSRMGEDKGLMSYRGQSMVKHVIDVAEKLTSNIMLVANHTDYHQLGWPVFPDLVKDKGPLAGIVTGLKASDTELNLILTCDTPFISVDFLKKLAAELDKAEVVIPQFENRLYPLTGYYKKTVLSRLETELEIGNLKIKKAIESLNYKVIVADQYDKNNFKNLNSKEDL